MSGFWNALHGILGQLDDEEKNAATYDPRLPVRFDPSRPDPEPKYDDLVSRADPTRPDPAPVPLGVVGGSLAQAADAESVQPQASLDVDEVPITARQSEEPHPEVLRRM